MTVIKQGLKGSNVISPKHSKNSFSKNIGECIIGRVFGVVTTENTPTPKMYEKAGGYSSIGTVFYLPYDSTLQEEPQINDVFLEQCELARPYNANNQYYPLLGELVEIKYAPSPLNKNNIIYWSSIVNLWNSSQQNSQNEDNLGKTYEENTKHKNLLSYEGDFILQGRKGSSIRFGSTVGLFSNPTKPNYNEWSSIGKNGSPILIISNGHNYNETDDLYVEKINKDNSSIYLTSNQSIPIDVDTNNIKSPICGEPILPKIYNKSQIIFNADRILINSKKDEILLFSKTNFLIKSENTSIFSKSILLDSNEVYLGNNNGKLPDEPLILGGKFLNMFMELFDSLQEFTNNLASSVDSNGVPIATLKISGDRLNTQLEEIKEYFNPDNTKKFIASNKIYIS